MPFKMERYENEFVTFRVLKISGFNYQTYSIYKRCNMEKLSDSTRAILKESGHLFIDHQDEITSRMYEIMFARHPEIKSMFERSQKHQPKIFAAAVMCHLVSMDNPEVLQSFRITMCRRHVMAGVKEEHYSMMAEALFEAMNEVLKDEATDEIIDAWKKWYYFLANLLIDRERDHYQGKHLLFPAGVDLEKHYYQDKFGILTSDKKSGK